jgi:predicted Rossmann fold flavoprotein
MINGDIKRIAVIGGGPAGMMAAGTAVRYGASVTIFEHTDRLGKKLAITGKGRCNVTNNCSPAEFLENVTSNSKFLYTALYTLTPQKAMELFEDMGVCLKTERGNRVFPSDDKAKTIVDAMRRYSKDATTVYSHVSAVIKRDDGKFEIKVKGDDCSGCVFDSVIIATGGKSYPLTGSDGSGYKLAMRLGHTVTELSPSLIPIESPSRICSDMMGLSLKNVAIKVLDAQNKCLYEDFGEMMFTHFGVTGPIILSSSSHIKGADVSALTLSIDLKPALDEKTLDARLISDFTKNTNKDFKNSLGALLPSKMIPTFIDVCGIEETKKVNSITKEERRKILRSLKDFRIPLSKFRPIEEAIITAGGINVKEISPKSMESKICPELYFAGEIIDVDAYTGGFNLQIAYSTGYLAGKNAAEIK